MLRDVLFCDRFSLLPERFHIFRSVFCYTKLICQMNYILCKYLHNLCIIYIFIKKHPTKLRLPCKCYNLGKIMNDCHCQSSKRSFGPWKWVFGSFFFFKTFFRLKKATMPLWGFYLILGTFFENWLSLGEFLRIVSAHHGLW